MRALLLLLLTWSEFLGCTARGPDAVEVVRDLPAIEVARPQDLRPAPSPPRLEANPHAGARSWCRLEWDQVCERDQDCAGTFDPLGLPTYCLRARWAKGSADVKVCRPGRFGPVRKQYMRERVRVYVDHVCEPPPWWEEDTACWQYRDNIAWECHAKRYCDPDDLHLFFRVVAQREANWKPYQGHLLNPDIQAAKSSWRKHARRFRWRVQVDKWGEVVEAYPTLPGFNLFYENRWRWRGLGLYGQNTPLWIPAWDMRAPPESFCREVPSSEAYLRTARSVWRKINQGLDCDGDGERDWYGSGILTDGTALPTWADVHQGASVGKLCPRQKPHDLFAARASKINLDADEPIRLVRLGKQIKPARQYLVAAWRQVRMNLVPRP
jgi:hypothetical protein